MSDRLLPNLAKLVKLTQFGHVTNIDETCVFHALIFTVSDVLSDKTDRIPYFGTLCPDASMRTPFLPGSRPQNL